MLLITQKLVVRQVFLNEQFAILLLHVKLLTIELMIESKKVLANRNQKKNEVHSYVEQNQGKKVNHWKVYEDEIVVEDLFEEDLISNLSEQEKLKLEQMREKVVRWCQDPKNPKANPKEKTIAALLRYLRARLFIETNVFSLIYLSNSKLKEMGR